MANQRIEVQCVACKHTRWLTPREVKLPRTFCSRCGNLEKRDKPSSLPISDDTR